MWILGCIALLLLTCSVNQVEADNLLLVHAIWRHGDRTPLASFPKDPHRNSWPQGFGQLTSVGEKQHRELGKWLRDRYVTDYKLLPTTYDSKYISIQSTNYERTINSAKNNFIGMYNIVPTIDIPPTQSKTAAVLNTNCLRTTQLQTMMKRSYYFKKYQRAKQALFTRLTQLTGTTQNFGDITRLADTLRVEMIKGMLISSSLRQLWTRIRAAENTYDLLFWGYTIGNYFGQNMHIEIPKSLGGLMLKTIIDQMKLKAQGRLTTRYYAYSAHDSTIMSALSTFGFSMYDYNRNLGPSYASVLLFELWQRESDKVPYVRVIYRRDATHIYNLSNKIHGCRHTNGCTLDQFIKRSSPYVTSNVAKFCATKPRGY